MFGSYYYGVIAPADAGPNVGNATIPSSGVTCLSTTSGINNLLADNERVLAYPNPASDQITLVLRNDRFTQCLITDLLGKVVYNGVNSLPR